MEKLAKRPTKLNAEDVFVVGDLVKISADHGMKKFFIDTPDSLFSPKWADLVGRVTKVGTVDNVYRWHIDVKYDLEGRLFAGVHCDHFDLVNDAGEVVESRLFANEQWRLNA